MKFGPYELVIIPPENMKFLLDDFERHLAQFPATTFQKLHETVVLVLGMTIINQPKEKIESITADDLQEFITTVMRGLFALEDRLESEQQEQQEQPELEPTGKTTHLHGDLFAAFNKNYNTKKVVN